MPEKSDYCNISREELRKYSADTVQLASCRLSSLEDGNGRGMRIIDVNNGSGLSFTIVPLFCYQLILLVVLLPL